MLSKELASLSGVAEELLIITEGAREDFHEPYEQGITLTAMVGTKLDNAWGSSIEERHIRLGVQEAVIVLHRCEDGTNLGTAAVGFNLASLIALARVGAKTITTSDMPVRREAPEFLNDKSKPFTKDMWCGFAGASSWSHKHPPIWRQVTDWLLVADAHGIGAYGQPDDNGWQLVFDIPNQAIATFILDGFPADFEPSKFGFTKG